MLKFYGVTEIQTDSNLLLTTMYFNLMRTENTLFISVKAFPIARYLKVSGNEKEPVIFTFYELRELSDFMKNEIEFILRKRDISLIILHEIDFIFLERPFISVVELQKILQQFKDLNKNVNILVKMMKKRSCQFLSLKMEYFIDWRYSIVQKNDKIYLKDHIIGNVSEMELI